MSVESAATKGRGEGKLTRVRAIVQVGDTKPRADGGASSDWLGAASPVLHDQSVAGMRRGGGVGDLGYGPGYGRIEGRKGARRVYTRGSVRA